MQVCVSVTKLLLFRLVVTEAGRNPTLAHLELSFQHGYVPRDTTEVNMTPPMKKQRKESTWKQNPRSVRHAKAEPDEVVVDSYFIINNDLLVIKPFLSSVSARTDNVFSTTKHTRKTS